MVPHACALCDREGVMVAFYRYRAELFALRCIKELAEAAGGDFQIVERATKECLHGWIFFYNTKRFLETGGATYALAGNGPIYVSRHGAVHVLPSSRPWEDAIKEFAANR
ncbi:YrhB domain-containing protein [Aquabacterium sp.]|uniref:YrhB domain-containing protein n=1 Tax=Aquabacterium sp. TaxID=1872578 RepID=UPI0040382924